MAKGKEQPRSSWRTIQQKNQRGKATTKVARKRRLVLLLRSALLILLLMAIVTGVVLLKYFGGMPESPAEPAGPTLVEVDFLSNGVLTDKWFHERFPEIRMTDIRQIDVHQLKETLAGHGQVRSASVTVILPSELKIELEEREPVLRIRLRDSEGRPLTLLVGRDGVLFEGAAYPQETLLRLPGVAGLRVKMGEDGYLPISGLEPVAQLLDLAKEKLPALYGHWKVVDLSDWNPEIDYRPSLIRVVSSHIEEIIFSSNGLEEQVDQLGGILQHIQRYQLGQPKSIDLSFGEEAVIRYK
ncbi:MAG: cell division protein FtsQ/DivIB [Opitutales bacterium]|jgi:hypothetical protein